MRLLSVNVGMPAKHMIDGKEVTTGIVKWPVPGCNQVKVAAMHLSQRWRAQVAARLSRAPVET
jgi:hypothetical protein